MSRPGLRVVMRRLRRETQRGLLREPFHFQAPPLEEFSYTLGHSHTDFETLGAGQFSRPGGRLLRTAQFNTLAVDYAAAWNLREDPPGADPLDVADALREIAHSGTPFKLVVHSPQLWRRDDLNMAATLRQVQVSERSGELDARYFDLSFVEYRDQDVGRRGYGDRAHELPATVVVRESGVCVEVRVGGEPAGKKERHHIGRADRPATLRDLARHFYGKNEWRAIAKANGLRNFPGDRGLDELPRRGRKEPRLRIPERKGRGD